jgi:hypothetical protein
VNPFEYLTAFTAIPCEQISGVEERKRESVALELAQIKLRLQEAEVATNRAQVAISGCLWLIHPRQSLSFLSSTSSQQRDVAR